ncbi:MAG: ArsR family transcriptional regulator [Planctomycetota bacterium]|nr:MAG: ArsR family transcriptional regulator [Planctomycetota bacterium]
MTVATHSLPSLLRVLSDETRLRILRLAAQAELSVGEIARCLAMGQSRVSNHLKILREVGLVGERHEGSYTFCRLEVPRGAVGQLWDALAPALDSVEARDADQARLAVVLAERSDSRSFFDRIAGDWDVIGSDFKLGTGRLSAASCLVDRALTVADVGCGTGYLAAALGRRVGRLVCVDNSPAMLDHARANLAGASAQVEYRLGVIEELPIADQEVDAAFAHMVLHHLSDTRAGLAEMVRIVRPGGLVCCVDLLPHRECWMRAEMADTRLGLDPAVLEDDLLASGLVQVEHEILADRYLVDAPGGRRVELPLHLVRGRKPA